MLATARETLTKSQTQKEPTDSFRTKIFSLDISISQIRRKFPGFLDT